MDVAALKAREVTAWASVAPGWHKHDARLTAYTAPVTHRLIQLADIRAGHRVLDIASGTGEPAIPIAERVGANGHVLGTDLVEEMLVFARDKAKRRGLGNIEFRRADGEEIDVPTESFDAVTNRWGLMFMPDPRANLERCHRALKPGGRIALACWAEPERNPWAAIPLGVLKRHMDVPTPPPGAPGIFSFADPSRIRSALVAAAFNSVTLDEVGVAMEFNSGADYFTFICELAGPIAGLYGRLSPDTQAIVAREVAGEAERHGSSPPIVVRGVTWVASGQK